MPFLREATSSRRPRGRPRAIKRFEKKRAAPKDIRPRPRSIDRPPPDPKYKKLYLPALEAVDELEKVSDMQGQECLEDILTAIEIDPTLFASPFSISQISNAPSTAAMSRVNRRPYETRIQRELEAIQSCSLLMTGEHRDPWVSFERALHSGVIEFSYIYEDTLTLLGHSYEPYPIWKVATHLGILEAKGFINIYMSKDPYGGYTPALVKFFVLPGSPPQGGVSFILGSSDLNVAYGGIWRP